MPTTRRPLPIRMRSLTFRRGILLAALALAAAVFVRALPARADSTVAVTTNLDSTTSGDGVCSLR